MPLSPAQQFFKSDKPIWLFLLCWTVLNTLQAYSLELHADEAYYWMYSKFLDWGYFDHPPMVAVFIKIGDTLVHNELGLRLITILTSTISVYLLWLILKKYAVSALSFILVISGILIFHIYGFTTTPDVPLFFFVVLFYFVYQKYIENDKWLLALALGVIVACMLYSKYHAVLLILFTVASNIKLLKRTSFWGIAVLAVVLYVPHILWQIQHNYPSVNYHLYERSELIYNHLNSLAYFPGQLLMAGPVIGWFLFYSAFTVRIKDAFIRCLMVNAIGTLAFFLFTTIRGEAQPHWTLIAYAPLAMLALIRFNQNDGPPTWFYRAAIINTLLIVIFRFCIIFHVPIITDIGQIKSYYGFKEWTKVVKQKAGDNYIVMSDGFQNPAKYDYYTNSLQAFSYDSRYYRRTQFDIWPMEEHLQGKKVLYLFDYPVKEHIADSIKTEAGRWYVEWLDGMRTYQKVKIETTINQLQSAGNEKKTFDLTITNPYPYSINFSNKGAKYEAFLGACFFAKDSMMYAQRADTTFNNLSLKPGESTRYIFNVTMPPQKGRYDMLFSIRTTPFAGSKNSHSIDVTIK